MASFNKICAFAVLISLLLISSNSTFASGHQFEVGGEMGWVPPSGSETESYNEWAEQHRFHIGDILYFKYQNDTVLLVKEEDYETCNISSPIESFGEGGAMFKFDRHGFFYFISGDQENCDLGQKIIIRVMVQNEYHPSSHSPAPSPGGFSGGGGGGSHGGDGGWNPRVAFNSTTMLSITSYLMTTIAGVFLILYLFLH